MKKLFISQPMQGKSDEEILRERAEAIEAAKNLIGEDVAYSAKGWSERRCCKNRQQAGGFTYGLCS